MSKEKPSKLGKGLKDIFSKTDKEPLKERLVAPKEEIPAKTPSADTVKTPRGRPQVHEESWTKVTTVLFDNQIHWLDTLAANIRQKTRAAVSRAELIRAMIAATEESGINLSDVTSEQEIKSILLEKLKK